MIEKVMEGLRCIGKKITYEDMVGVCRGRWRGRRVGKAGEGGEVSLRCANQELIFACISLATYSWLKVTHAVPAFFPIITGDKNNLTAKDIHYF